MSAARHMVGEVGLTVSIQHLSMEDLIRIADVPRSSVYRRWRTKEEFFTDLLIMIAQSAVKENVIGWVSPVADVVTSLLADNEDLHASAEGKIALFRECARVGVEQTYKSLLDSPRWQTRTSLLAAATSMTDQGREQVLAALQEGEMRSGQQISAFYGEVFGELGLPLRPGVSIEIVTLVGATTLDGFLQRRLTSPQVDELYIEGPALRGGTAPWHVAACAYLGAVSALLVNVPRMPFD